MSLMPPLLRHEELIYARKELYVGIDNLQPGVLEGKHIRSGPGKTNLLSD